jgi:predicted PurR-regulated permease PerM
MDGEARSNRGEDGEERRALRWTALAAVAAVLWLVKPVGMGIFLGLLLGFAFEPLYCRAAGRWRAPVAALVTVGAAMILVVAAIGCLAWLLVRDGTALGHEFAASLGSDGSAHAILGSIGGVTKRFGITSDDLIGRLRSLAEGAMTHAGALAAGIAATTSETLLTWLFALLTMYSVLSGRQQIRAAAEQTLPLRPDYTRKLITELRDVGRQTLVGTFGTAFVQGLLATLGYWLAGLPRPVFFGAATALVSLLPALGTMLVWAPAGIVLMVQGHVGRGIFLIAWGVLVVTSLNDYVIRPRFMRREGGLPPLAMLAALFGGVTSMGLKGLIVGPVVMSLSFAVLKLYREETCQRRSAAPG